MKRKWMTLLLSVAVMAMVVVGWASAQETGDGVPDNCEYTGAAYYQANVFPRYEPSASRVVLVDWTTGADVRDLETGLVTNSFQVRGWSADCRYLVGAILNAAGNYDTVVWDAVNGGRVGTIPDAVGHPHYVTWGFGGYLVVETRNGAILWNVSTNSQLILTTSWDTYTVRNFNRLRWDAEHNQLIVNLVGGGRVVYDLATGAEIPIAASADEVADGANYIVIAGNRYQCGLNSYSNYGGLYYGGATSPNGLSVDYLPATQSVVLEERRDEVVQIVESNLAVEIFSSYQWSQDCHYFAASVGSRQRRDTVVWDMRTLQRAAVFEDARDIRHELKWSPIPDYAVIETGEGAYLWHIPSDTRTLLTAFAEVIGGSYSRISSFHSLYWDLGRSQILAVTRETPNAVTVYDARSGAVLAQYSIGTRAAPVEFSLRGDNQILLATRRYNGYDHTQPRGFAVFDRNTGSGYVFTSSPDLYSYSAAFSPDGRYMVVGGRRVLDVWDLQNMNPDGTRNTRLVITSGYNPQFTDATTVETRGYSPNLLYSWNITTGELVSTRELVGQSLTTNIVESLPPVATTSMPGTSGRSTSSRYIQDGRECPYPQGAFFRPGLISRYESAIDQLSVTNGQETVLLEGAGSGVIVAWSPDCHYIVAQVSTNVAVPYDDAGVGFATRNEDRDTELVIWDTLTGARLQSFSNPYRRYNRGAVFWSPSGERAIVRVTSGYYIWEITTNSVAFISFEFNATDTNGYITGLPYWDYRRGQVLFLGGYGRQGEGVFAFDMITGEQRYFFGAAADTSYYYIGSANFSLSADGTLLFIGGFDQMTVWNLEALQMITRVDIDNWSTAYSGRSLVSPDGRWLVIVRANIRVWDLSTLASRVQDRDPVGVYAGPLGVVQNAQFVDNVTIEVTTRGGEISYWDITTGAQVER